MTGSGIDAARYTRQVGCRGTGCFKGGSVERARDGRSNRYPSIHLAPYLDDRRGNVSMCSIIVPLNRKHSYRYVLERGIMEEDSASRESLRDIESETRGISSNTP